MLDNIDMWYREIEDRKDKAAAIEMKRVVADRKKEIAGLKRNIENTYTEIIELYKEYDIELAKNYLLEPALKRSYGSKAGAIVTKRNKFKRRLEKVDV